MQEISWSIRLFTKPYSVRSWMERTLLVLALCSVALHGWLLYQLIAVRDFHSAITFLYLFSLLPFSLFLASVWLDRNPGYQRHLTLTSAGVQYRLGFLQRELEFDWEEIEHIRVESGQVIFSLKNDAVHHVSLDSVSHKSSLERLVDELKPIADRNGIALQVNL